tara:strand:- start:2582 stop:4069 length:1488 start_codon:yes stop_codon:yes gene_type:complete
MADITEIIEESAVQLEIVESGGGQIEIVDTSSTQIEIVETTLDSSDLDISTQTNTLVVETTTDSTNVDIIVDPSTIVETTTTTNTIEITENQVIFQTGSTFINYYNSESVSSSITSSFALRAENAATASYILNPVVGETVKFQTQSNSNSSSLLNLVIKDYSNDVSVNVKGGSLELTFGSPSLPTISDINVESFDTNRFDLVNDSYILTPQFDLNGTTFIKGMLSSSTNGIVEFTENSSITISQETFPTYATGSHTFTINIITQLADNSQLTISTDKVLTLNKLNPSSPTITNINYSITEDAYRDSQSEIEEGATGSIVWTLTSGLVNGSNGWVGATPQYNSHNTTLPVSILSTITTGTVEQYWNSSTNNSIQDFHTGSVSRTWDRVRSLRYASSLIESYTITQLQNLPNWPGTIKYGHNTQEEVSSQIISFTPPSSGEYLYIVYDNILGSLTKIINQDSNQDEISVFNSSTLLNYRVYRTTSKKNIVLTYKVEF